MQMSKDLFAKLVEAVQATPERTLSNAEAARWLKKLSDDDTDLMSQADVLEVCIVTKHLRAAILTHDNDKYLCLCGQDTDDDLPDGFEAVDLTPGLFALAITKLKLAPTASSIEIFDVIEDSYKGLDDYTGHDLDDIARLFPNVSVLILDQNTTSSGSIWRVLGVLLAVFYGDGPIELDQATLADLKELYETGSEHVPFRNILQGHLAMNWTGLFLELYRSIEQLYAVPKLLNLTSEWASTEPYFKLAELLENQLGWRPKEEDALRELIEQCGQPLLDSLAQEFCPEAENKAQGIARAIYKQRNSLVHFRPAMPEEEFSVAQWNNRISQMIKLVSELYGAHGAGFKLPRP